MSKEDSCSSCCYWKNTTAAGGYDERWGQCRRCPPPTSGPNTQWPLTVADDWCGEYRSKVGQSLSGDLRFPEQILGEMCDPE